MEIISRREAKEAGLRRYFTGEPCRHQHDCERYVATGQCIECMRIKGRDPVRMAKKRIYSRERWRNNPEVKERGKIAAKKFKGSPKNLATRRAWSKTEKARETRNKYTKTAAARAARNERHAIRIAADVQYRLKHTIRNRIRRAFEENYQTGDALRLLGCTIDFLRAHLERQFTAGMTWKNMGKTAGKWNIDHILPLASFDLSDPKQAAEACNYKNLQPLWHEDNMRKKAKHPVLFALENGRLL